mmetsp:Transcript_15427/g.33997  ORF Transcript_15427/g.33997 Transcript_15427/m.33997 type:complete len:233 (-) Transcript_15427:2675-3373(-)
MHRGVVPLRQWRDQLHRRPSHRRGLVTCWFVGQHELQEIQDIRPDIDLAFNKGVGKAHAGVKKRPPKKPLGANNDSHWSSRPVSKHRFEAVVEDHPQTTLTDKATQAPRENPGPEHATKSGQRHQGSPRLRPGAHVDTHGLAGSAGTSEAVFMEAVAGPSSTEEDPTPVEALQLGELALRLEGMDVQHWVLEAKAGEQGVSLDASLGWIQGHKDVLTLGSHAGLQSVHPVRH